MRWVCSLQPRRGGIDGNSSPRWSRRSLSPTNPKIDRIPTLSCLCRPTRRSQPRPTRSHKSIRPSHSAHRHPRPPRRARWLTSSTPATRSKGVSPLMAPSRPRGKERSSSPRPQARRARWRRNHSGSPDTPPRRSKVSQLRRRSTSTRPRCIRRYLCQLAYGAPRRLC